MLIACIKPGTWCIIKAISYLSLLRCEGGRERHIRFLTVTVNRQNPKTSSVSIRINIPCSIFVVDCSDALHVPTFPTFFQPWRFLYGSAVVYVPSTHTWYRGGLSNLPLLLVYHSLLAKVFTYPSLEGGRGRRGIFLPYYYVVLFSSVFQCSMSPTIWYVHKQMLISHRVEGPCILEYILITQTRSIGLVVWGIRSRTDESTRWLSFIINPSG